MLSTAYVPGAPVWLDIGARDSRAVAAFYGALFGWEFHPGGPEVGGYGLLRLGGATVAAVGPLPEDHQGPSSWIPYFHTLDADASARAVRQAGGSVLHPSADVLTLGRMAHFRDPAGAGFAVWQPRDNKGLDLVNAPGALCWTELYTTDAATATCFYRAVFGWSLRDMPVGDTLYTAASPSGGGRESPHAGIMQLPPEDVAAGTASGWHPYFEVTDCDTVAATAAAHGAAVLIPVTDMPGMGRIAMFTDPFGAPFAVIAAAAPR